jgi:hypothetical protein
MRTRAVTNRMMQRWMSGIMGALSCIGACGGHATNNGLDSPTTAEGGASKGGAGGTGAAAAPGASSGGQLSHGGQGGHGGGESGTSAVLGGAPAAQGGETTDAGGEPIAAEGGAAGVSAGGTGGAAVCVPACEASCVVGAVSCLGNRVGTCASDGTSLASRTSDCAASGQVCDQFQHCAAQATDVLGGVYDAVPTKSGEILVDIVDVFSDRVAVGLEAELVLQVDTTLTWVIYEWDVNRFKLGFAVAVMVPANLNGPPGTEQLYGSSLFSYSLRAGKRYALGLVVGDGVSVNPSDSPDGRELSFGHFVGGATAEGTDFHDQSSFQPTSTINLLGIYTLPAH